jgi:hypothetical protein
VIGASRTYTTLENKEQIRIETKVQRDGVSSRLSNWPRACGLFLYAALPATRENPGSPEAQGPRPGSSATRNAKARASPSGLGAGSFHAPRHMRHAFSWVLEVLHPELALFLAPQGGQCG